MVNKKNLIVLLTLLSFFPWLDEFKSKSCFGESTHSTIQNPNQHQCTCLHPYLDPKYCKWACKGILG